MRAGLLALAVLALAAPGCRKRRAAAANASAPRLVLAETRWDFGHALTHDVLQHAFQLRNAGGAPLVLDPIEAGHECSVATPALTVQANESAAFVVSCKPDQYGAFASLVTLHPPGSASVTLELSADVSPRLAWKEPVLAFDLSFGAEKSAQVELIGALAREARLAPRGLTPAGLRVAVAHTEAGDRLDVRALGRAVGTSIGELTVETGLSDPARLTLPFSVSVTGTLAVDPSNPYFDLLSASGRGVQIRASSAQPGFRVLGADVLDGPFQASFLGVPGGAYRVTVAYLPERARREQGEQRGTLGHLRLRSNDRTEPSRVLTLMAFGRASVEPK